MSEKSTTTSYKFNFNCTLKIQKENVWVSSNDLISSEFPDFKFNISAQQNDNNKLDIKVTKSFFKPANALIELTLDGMLPRRRDVTNWIDSVILKNLLILFSRDMCQKSYYHSFEIPIECSIIWFGFTDDLQNAKINNNNMEIYFKNFEFSDVKIRAKDNEEFPAHKIILAANSPVFRKMLTTDMKESRENCIDLPELSSDIVNKLLYFLYHGKLDKAGDDNAILLELVEVADMYCISGLKNACDAPLSNNLSSENVISLLEFSRVHNLFILQHRALTFIVNNVNSLHPQKM